MRGVIPKAPGVRQRRNRVATRALLPSSEESAQNDVPALPRRAKDQGKWHPMVLEWWEAVWRSPMAAEYLDADMKGGLYLLAELHQQRWTADSAKDVIAAAAEIRHQEVRFGLSPIDRRRLQWEVEKAESAVEKTATRRQRQNAPKGDPRDVLRLAK